MSTGKSEFRLTFHVAPEEINRVIEQYLSANGFAMQQKGNAVYYVSKRGLSEKRFEYYIDGNQLLILAYMGTYEKPQKLEGLVGAVPKQMYQEQILKLMQELERVGQGNRVSTVTAGNNDRSGFDKSSSINSTGMNSNINGGMNSNINGSMNSSINSAGINMSSQNVFLEDNNKKNETWAVVGFVISIVGLLVSCMGIALGGTLVFLEFWCAYMGLQSKKKGLSIATIVIAIISLLIIILQLFLKFAKAF